MTPSDKPFDSANEPENTQNNPPLSSPASEAAALEAIEALETETSKIADEPATPEADSTSTTTPAPNSEDSSAVRAMPTDSSQSSTQPIISGSSATASPSTQYQPFTAKKSNSKRMVVIALIAVLIVGLGAVGAYFGLQYLQPQSSTQTPAQTVPDEGELSGEGTDTATEKSVTKEITEIDAQLNSIDDTEYDDKTLSDESLYK